MSEIGIRPKFTYLFQSKEADGGIRSYSLNLNNKCRAKVSDEIPAMLGFSDVNLLMSNQNMP